MAVYVNGVNLAYYYFHYVPNYVACFVAIAVFAVHFVLLTSRVIRTKSPRFLFMLPFTALCECVGFGLRYAIAENPSTSLYTGMTVLLLLSANILALVNYKAVGDVIALSGVETRCVIIGPRFTKIFYQTNLIASILQIVAGSMQASAGTSYEGYNLAIAGVAVQLAFFALFLACTVYVHTCSDYQYFIDGKNPKNSLMWATYVTMSLVFARYVYRLASYILLADDPQDIYEWTFYVFDAFLIALCFVMHYLFWYGKYLPHNSQELDIKPENTYVMDNVNQQQSVNGNCYPLQSQQYAHIQPPQYPPSGYNNA